MRPSKLLLWLGLTQAVSVRGWSFKGRKANRHAGLNGRLVAEGIGAARVAMGSLWGRATATTKATVPRRSARPLRPTLRGERALVSTCPSTSGSLGTHA